MKSQMSYLFDYQSIGWKRSNCVRRRDELERRLTALLETIERADQLVNQVAVVSNYLTSDLKNVGEALETAKHKQDFAIRIIRSSRRRA